MQKKMEKLKSVCLFNNTEVDLSRRCLPIMTWHHITSHHITSHHINFSYSCNASFTRSSLNFHNHYFNLLSLINTSIWVVLSYTHCNLQLIMIKESFLFYTSHPYHQSIGYANSILLVWILLGFKPITSLHLTAQRTMSTVSVRAPLLESTSIIEWSIR